MTGKKSLIAGHSGVGKSTLINLLAPEIEQKTSEVSDFANKGVHTTTFAEMFRIDHDTFIIDTPGIKELALADKIHSLLGKPDAGKIFFASLLVSLLRPQQLAAHELAKQRQEMKE